MASLDLEKLLDLRLLALPLCCMTKTTQNGDDQKRQMQEPPYLPSSFAMGTFYSLQFVSALYFEIGFLASDLWHKSGPISFCHVEWWPCYLFIYLATFFL